MKLRDDAIMMKLHDDKTKRQSNCIKKMKSSEFHNDDDGGYEMIRSWLFQEIWDLQFL